MRKGILFDLDGTLWDAVEQIKNSWNQTMERLALPYRFSYLDIKSHMGLTPEETVHLAFPDLLLSKGLEIFKQCVNDEIIFLKHNPGILYADEEEVLSALSKKYLLFVVSNSDKGYIENYLQTYHFEKYFSGHLCAGDTNKDKHDNILIVKDKYHLDKYLYVGDTNKDYIETKKANGIFIHAKYGFGTISDKVLAISDLKQLLKLADDLLDR